MLTTCISSLLALVCGSSSNNNNNLATLQVSSTWSVLSSTYAVVILFTVVDECQ
jgi:hypothetical protein